MTIVLYQTFLHTKIRLERVPDILRHCLSLFVFVLETIRAGAMRVIHIPVKTEKTQRLRIKFAEREALRMRIEHLTVLFPTEVSSFDFQVECTDRTVQYKHC